MKLKLIDRILIALYAVMGTLALMTALIWTCNPESAAGMGTSFEFMMRDAVAVRVGLGVLIAILIALSAFIIWKMTRAESVSPKDSIPLQSGAGGEVRVSVAALDALVRQAMGTVAGVEKMNMKLAGSGDALSVSIDMTVYASAFIPSITQAAQDNVRRAIEEFAGVAVRDVTVLVSGIVPDLPAPLPPEKTEKS